MVCMLSLFKSIRLLSLWDIRKSTVYATEGNKVQDLQRLMQNGSQMIRTTPGISQRVSNHCSDMQRLALTLKVNTSSTDVNLQEAVTQACVCKTSFFL